MTKSELKTGMVVTYRDGRKAMVFKDCEYFDGTSKDILVTEEETWLDFSYIKEDLTYRLDDSSDLDIMMVEKQNYINYIWNPYNPNNYTKIWERNLPKKMTVAEIEAILGHKVEIISEQ